MNENDIFPHKFMIAHFYLMWDFNHNLFMFKSDNINRFINNMWTKVNNMNLKL